MTMRRRLVPLLLLAAAMPAHAADPAALNRQIADNRAVRELALSPDGRTVAAMITETTTDGGLPHLWVLTKGAPPRQLTRDAEDRNPAWTTDGRAVLVLEKTGGVTRLRRIDAGNGRTETLVLARQNGVTAGGWDAAPMGSSVNVVGYAQAPDGTLALWASDPSDAADKAARKDDAHPFEQAAPMRLYVIAAGAVREIPLPDTIHSVGWSADSRRMLVVTAPASDDLGAPNRLWLVGDGAAPRAIAPTAPDVQTAAWLADGRIVSIGRCRQDAPIVCHDLYVQALDGSAPRDLTDGLDGSLVNGVDDGGTGGPIVTPDGDVLLTVARHFDEQVARVRVSDGRVTWLAGLPAVVRALATNPARTAYAVLGAARGGVVTAGIADAALHAYTPLPVPALQAADWAPLCAQPLSWRSDGQAIDGLLYLPAGAAAAHPVPLVVDVHGGPAMHFEDIDYPLVRLLLAEGWAVLHVNPRGSIGYGPAFMAALKDDLGGADYRDILRGVDAALAQAPLDGGRMALIGYSYGGTMASFALGRSDRFRAYVAAAPVADQFSEYGNEGSSWYDRWYFGQPWRRVEAAWRQSPLAGVAHAHAPLLLFQGESDTVDPPGQSQELYRALRQEGAPVDLLMFPRETHRELGLNYYGFTSSEPYHGIVLRQRLLDWLAQAFAR